MSEPADADVLRWLTELSNWNRWGADDEAGALNLIDAGCRRAAAALVVEGRAVSCAHDIRPHGPNAQRYMVATGLDLHDHGEGPERAGAMDRGRGAAAAEFLGVIYHGLTITHIDAPSHVFWDGKMYNGAPAALVNDRQGATRSDVRAAGTGIVSRGVLVDVAGFLGLEAMEPGQPVLVEPLERAGTTVRSGDVLLVRTGEAQRRAAAGAAYDGMRQPGLHASCLPWLHGHGVAVLGSDSAQDVRPSGVVGFSMPIHTVGIVAMGLWLIDNCNLEDLAATCAELNRWEFQFFLGPLRFRGATGSPANPIAVF
jgi:kynurenine formamidase